MDHQTFTNHIVNLGRVPIDIACKLILREVFKLHPINVDGSGDAGSDYTALKGDGTKESVAYQITTQKTQLASKAYRDAEKAIKKLGAKRFYFFTTVDLKETAVRKLENDIINELHIPAVCLAASHIAALILDEGLLNSFLDAANYPLPRSIASAPDLQEIALHGLTLLSDDSKVMRESVYDDAILLVSSMETLSEPDLVLRVVQFLNLSADRQHTIQKRIGALFAQELLSRAANKLVEPSTKAAARLRAQEQLYQRELDDLVAAQTDLMRRDYGANWTIENSRDVGILIAHIYISSQLSVIRATRPEFALNPVLKLGDCSVADVKSFLVKQRLIDPAHVDSAAFALINISSAHPLIVKLARASVCLALEGRNPLAASKALGASRWSDYSILVEPSVAIPVLCDTLYKGDRNAMLTASVKAVNRAKELDVRLFITYFYINECAGHLLRARKYANIPLDEHELAFSPNAFVSNYYSLKAASAKLPTSFDAYLKTFSPAIAIPRVDIREWIRAIMTDLQSLFSRANVSFAECPFYDHNHCAVFEKEYTYYLEQHHRMKPKHLIDHDAWALQFVHDRRSKFSEHWLILTYDKAMAEVGSTDRFAGWVAPPASFLDLTETSSPLHETQYTNVIHRIASFSERSLSAGARILDRVIHHASTEMQNWEFLSAVQTFKETTIKGINLESTDSFDQLDVLTDTFLEKKGIQVRSIGPEDEMVDVD